MTSIVVHTNAPVSETLYIVDSDGAAVAIADGDYKTQWRRRGYYAAAAIEFVTGGGTGLGTITKGTSTIEGVAYDVLLLAAAQSLVATLAPGAYEADVLRTDTAEWIMDYSVEVVQGVTSP